MSDDLIDRLTAAFMGHADHVDRNLFGRARDALQAQAAEIAIHKGNAEDNYRRSVATESKVAEAIGKAERQWEGWVKEEVRRKAAEAKLREAVKVMQAIEEQASYGLGVGDMYPQLRTIEREARAFLATMEKPNDPR